MKKSNLVVSALAASMMILAGCGAEEPETPAQPEEPACSHVDANPKDHICDLCGETLSQCVDEEPKDHICDYCGKEMSEHSDVSPKDHICDYCGAELSQHSDIDPKDHLCDYCGAELSQHIDAEPKDHICDYCGAEMSQHIDAEPKDHTCDYCGAVLSEHSDENHDLICDYCEAELDGIKEVAIASKRSYIGVGESFSMSGEAVVSGSVTNNAVTFSTESTLVGLAQTENSVVVTAGSEKGEATIKAVSVFDSEKSKEVTIAIEEWSYSDKNKMSGTNGVLQGQNLPYMRTMKALISGMGATDVTAQIDLPEYEEAIEALVDGGYSKKEVESKVFYVKDHPTYFGYEIQVEIKGVDLENPEEGYYNFVASLAAKELSEFPASAVEAVLEGKTESAIPMPEDGTSFKILRNDGALIEVELNGDPSAFISKLENGNYYINRDNTRSGYTTYVMSASPERTLLVHVSIKEGLYTITYTTQTIPEKSDWTSAEKTKMTNNFGYVLPFVNVGISLDSKGVGTTSRVEALDMILAAYEADENFTGGPVLDETGKVLGYVYKHVLSDFFELQVGISRSGAKTTIQGKKVAIPQETWPTEGVAALVHGLDETTTTVIPEVSGFSNLIFVETYLSYGIQAISVNMGEEGSDPTTAYVEALTLAGWSIKESGTQFTDTTYTAVSPDKKIALELGYFDSAKEFDIFFYVNTLGFKYEEMKGIMTQLGSTNDPVAPASADFYMFYTSNYYWSYYGIYEIYTFGSDAASILTAFEDAWTNAGWTLVNLFGNYFYQKGAISPDGKVCVEYGLDGEYFDMYYREADEFAAWSVEEVANIVSNLVPAGSSTVVPEFGNSNHFAYNFNATYNVGQIYCETADSESAILAYVEVLEGASWVETDPSSSGDRVFISPESDLKMTIVDEESSVYLQLESYVAPAAEWPSEGVEALTPSGIRDSVPAYNGEEVSSFQINTSGYNPAVFMYSSDLAATSAAYAAACEALGYTNDAEAAEGYGLDYVLTSENEDITLYVYRMESDGIVTVEIEFNPLLTVENLTAFLTRYGYTTTGVEDFISLVSTSTPAPRYYETTSSYYTVLVFSIDSSMLEDAKSWALGLGLKLYGSSSTKWSYTDDDWREIDIQIMSDGSIQIVIWEP